MIYGINGWHYPEVMAWFTEPAKMTMGYGYPAGTLLYYSEVK